MTQSWDVVVVGSCMTDLVSYAPRLPKSGETVCGTSFRSAFGGKGCNQCVAARKLGAKCFLVARVGNDYFGKSYYDKLSEYKISREMVKFTDNVSSGMAQITVAENGENQIVIVPGANDRLSPQDVQKAEAAITNCQVLICQLEVPEETTIEALKLKSKSKIGKSILNAAPARANLNPALFTLPDVFCVNETEAEIITGIPVTSAEKAREAIKEFLYLSCNEVIITLGAHGCMYGFAGSDEIVHVPSNPVVAVDTTGAGDAFIGALAYFFAKTPEMPMKEMLIRANFLAGISVQREGTQESFPLITELPEDI